MLHTELLRLWNDAVKAVDARDWQEALAKAHEITEPNSRTLFITASAHLALKQLELALQALNQVIANDEHLAVGFFQRAVVHMQLDRLEEALSDCIWAQKRMRGNPVIDYKQLGLRYKLYSWQVLYNAAAVYCRLGQWDQAVEVLTSASQGRGGGRGGTIDLAMESVFRRELLAPLLVPEGEVFRPRKEEVEQVQQRDFLGKAKVITSLIPNDDFGGFEPLRMQKPGFYEPKVDEFQDSRYMRVRTPYMTRGPGQLTVPGAALVFLLSEVDQDGMATVIYDGQRGLLPMTLLEPTDVKKLKGRKEERIPSGIPMPPALKPTRPKILPSPAAPAPARSVTETPPPSYINATLSPLSTRERHTDDASGPSDQDRTNGSAPGIKADSVIVKVHYRYTVALAVPADAPYRELQERVARKLGQPGSQLRLRYKPHGFQALRPLVEDRDPEEPGALLHLAESGRATLWCQVEDPLPTRPILYQMLALYNYAAQGPEDLEFSKGDTIDILAEVNEEWLEGHCAGNIGIFPSCFAYRETAAVDSSTVL